ncbi:MAG: cellulose-binding protein CttA-related protein [Ruminococcus sp.]|nr:cellulose-binding protein CttA-related protein [Ruminococcus sp.]
MKTSLFKRAVAAAAAVPLALTQCLTASFAVDFNDTALIAANKTASDEAITLETLCYIAPDQTESSWNTTIANKLKTTEKTNGTIDISSYISSITSKSAKYGSVAESVLKAINADGITYELKNNLDIVLTAKTDKAIDGLYNAAENSLKELAGGLAAKYGVAELADIDFTKVSTKGTVTVTIGTSALDSADGKKVEATFKFVDENGVEYDVEGSLAYAQAKLDEVKKVAYDAIDALPAGALTADEIAAAKADVDAQLADYQTLLTKAKNGITKANNAADKSVSGTVADVIAAVNSQLKTSGFNRQLPATATGIMTSATVEDNFKKAVEQIESATGVAIDIEAGQLGAFADSLTNVEATYTASEKKASFKGEFTDAEFDQVSKYYATQGKILTSSKKIITIDVDGSAALQGTGSVEVHIYRVVETEDIVTSSSSTTESSTTTTSTTTSETESVTTTTSTDADQPVVTTVVQDTYVELESTYGFYLDIDEEFAKDQIESATLNVVYTKGYTNDEGTVIVDETWSETYDIKDDVDFGSATPNNTYTKDNDTFKYEIPVFYNGAGIADKTGKIILQPGKKLADADEEIASVVVYIGVKGDADLNNMVDGADASLVLVYNAALSDGETSGNTVQLSNSKLVAGPTSVYDNFAAFLADAKHDASIVNDWNVMKADRLIDGTDASAILVYNAETVETGIFGRETWEKIVDPIH